MVNVKAVAASSGAISGLDCPNPGVSHNQGSTWVNWIRRRGSVFAQVGFADYVTSGPPAVDARGAGGHAVAGRRSRSHGGHGPARSSSATEVVRAGCAIECDAVAEGSVPKLAACCSGDAGDLDHPSAAGRSFDHELLAAGARLWGHRLP